MHLLVIACLFVGTFVVTNASSGLYVDNGVDRTLLQRFLTKDEKLEVESEMLHLLGLPGRPKRSVGSLDSAGSRFLLDVYKSLAGGESGADLVDQSDAIVSFKSQVQELEGREKGSWLTFDVSEVSPSATILGAELRILQSISSVTHHPRLALSLYKVHLEEGNSDFELVQTANVTVGSGEWLQLNISGPLSQWVMNPSSNQGLFLSLRSQSNGEEISGEEAGLLGGLEEPFAVAYLRGDGGPTTNTASKRRTRRAARSRKNTPNHPNPLTDWSQPQKSCQIQTLYVSFKDLNWQDWIIAPDGYGAFYCSGECNFPLNAHMNATNHAIVQTLVHLMNPLQVPKPCCAPTRLTPISVLYFLEDSNVILKKYKNMVVKSCGCH